MTEPIAATLDDLCSDVVNVTIARPDGKTVRVPLRALTERQLAEIRHRVTFPKPPIKDFGKGGTAILDYDNSEYQAKLEDAAAEVGRRCLLAMLQITIPGGTDDEKLAELEKGLGGSVYTQLLAAARKLNLASDKEIEAAANSFRPVRPAPAAGDALVENQPG